jgi:hypothetical protein
MAGCLLLFGVKPAGGCRFKEALAFLKAICRSAGGLSHIWMHGDLVSVVEGAPSFAAECKVRHAWVALRPIGRSDMNARGSCFWFQRITLLVREVLGHNAELFISHIQAVVYDCLEAEGVRADTGIGKPAAGVGLKPSWVAVEGQAVRASRDGCESLQPLGHRRVSGWGLRSDSLFPRVGVLAPGGIRSLHPLLKDVFEGRAVERQVLRRRPRARNDVGGTYYDRGSLRRRVGGPTTTTRGRIRLLRSHVVGTSRLFRGFIVLSLLLSGGPH